MRNSEAGSSFDILQFSLLFLPFRIGQYALQSHRGQAFFSGLQGPAWVGREFLTVQELVAAADAHAQASKWAESCFMSLAAMVCTSAAALLPERWWVQASLALP